MSLKEYHDLGAQIGQYHQKIAALRLKQKQVAARHFGLVPGVTVVVDTSRGFRGVFGNIRNVFADGKATIDVFPFKKSGEPSARTCPVWNWKVEEPPA